MEKEFVLYEQSLELKELGFDEPCFGCYGHQNDLWCENPVNSKSDIPEDNILSPLYQQAFRWFREKYKIHSSTFWMEIDKSIYWNYRYSYLDDKSTESVNRSIFYFNTTEEAELECLKKLIKIVKKQKEYESKVTV
jgi:hypothetical protein